MTRNPSLKPPDHPLAEVFGFPVDNMSVLANRARNNRLCPYNNRVPNCTKDKAENPLGVCSIYHKNNGRPVITCPVRFRQDWVVAENAARFFFPPGAHWTSLTEVRLNDANGNSAGNIDVVLVSYDDRGCLLDFGALEIQSVYISGNIRRPFEHYMKEPERRYNMNWRTQPNYPRPDYLSSSRKRLAPQLFFKGAILNSWGKKLAVALDISFFSTLPSLPETEISSAEMVWLVYNLEFDPEQNRFMLSHHRSIYSPFQLTISRITVPEPGSIDDFLKRLQEKLDEKLESSPDAPTLDSFIS